MFESNIKKSIKFSAFLSHEYHIIVTCLSYLGADPNWSNSDHTGMTSLHQSVAGVSVNAYLFSFLILSTRLLPLAFIVTCPYLPLFHKLIFHLGVSQCQRVSFTKWRKGQHQR